MAPSLLCLTNLWAALSTVTDLITMVTECKTGTFKEVLFLVLGEERSWY